MIIKFEFDFSNQELFDSIEREICKYNYIIYHYNVYVSDTKHNANNRLINKISGLIGEDPEILTDQSIVFEPKKIKDWYQIQKSWKEVIDYEKNNQRMLQNTMKQLDKIEQEIYNLEV